MFLKSQTFRIFPTLSSSHLIPELFSGENASNPLAWMMAHAMSELECSRVHCGLQTCAVQGYHYPLLMFPGERAQLTQNRIYYGLATKPKEAIAGNRVFEKLIIQIRIIFRGSAGCARGWAVIHPPLPFDHNSAIIIPAGLVIVVLWVPGIYFWT